MIIEGVVQCGRVGGIRPVACRGRYRGVRRGATTSGKLGGVFVRYR